MSSSWGQGAELRILPERLADDRLSELQAICSAIGASVLIGDDAVGNALPPRVAVTGLGRGARRVPQQVIQWLDENAPEACLLLLCEEPLIRSSVTRSEGRVTLVAWGSGRELIRSRLRMLLSEPPPAESDERVQGETLARRCWTACAGDRGSLTLHCDPEGNTRLALTIADAGATRTPSDSRALLRLPSSADAWHVDWPALPHTVWLLSTQRLPTATDLGAVHGGKGSVVVRAAPGDVALAVTPALGEQLARDLGQLLESNAAGGGPAVFDAVTRAARTSQASSVAVVEVR
jgi:hypothetical protein